MPSWGIVLAAGILALGLVLGVVLCRVVWLFCEGAGIVEQKPWEDE